MLFRSRLTHDRLDAVLGLARGLPAHAGLGRVAGAAREHLDAIRDDECGVEAHAELADQAGVLGIKTGDAGLLIERHGFGAGGQLVESTRSYYRGDAYDFVAELKAE